MQQISNKMQQTSDTSPSAMSLIPGELLFIILCHAMRSDMPVHLEHFLQIRRRLPGILNEHEEENVFGSSGPARTEESISESSAAARSEIFLDQLQVGQREHFRDWLLINSTCRNFRTWGKKAFFSEKIFVIRPPFLKNLCEESAKGIGAENLAAARAYIRHVIAPLNVCLASRFINVPRYHTFQNLRSLSLQTGCPDKDIFLGANSPTMKRYPLPKTLSALLRAIGLQTDQLQMEVQYHNDDKEHQVLMKLLADTVYPYLRIFSVRDAKGRITPSVDTAQGSREFEHVMLEDNH
ncbi:hypothetical protein MMC07_003935 [Pseudocyphellaria aurata]|nr:hypothetical protein [Pseudocyphellaria aurata]